MKSFRRCCGEGITTPVGMRGARMEGAGKTRWMNERWERRGRGYKRWESEKSKWAGRRTSGAKTRRAKSRGKPQAEGRTEAWRQTRFVKTALGDGYFLVISACSCARESPPLPPIISHRWCSSSPRTAALLDRLSSVIARNQRDEMWNRCDVLSMMPFTGRGCAGLCLVKKWALSTHLTLFDFLNSKTRDTCVLEVWCFTPVQMEQCHLSLCERERTHKKTRTLVMVS